MLNVSAATWNALSQLLDEAFNLEPAARAAWLAELAENAASARAHSAADSWLRNEQRNGGFPGACAEAGIAIEGVPR